jgi:hypothetical protein
MKGHVGKYSTPTNPTDLAPQPPRFRIPKLSYKSLHLLDLIGILELCDFLKSQAAIKICAWQRAFLRRRLRPDPGTMLWRILYVLSVLHCGIRATRDLLRRPAQKASQRDPRRPWHHGQRFLRGAVFTLSERFPLPTLRPRRRIVPWYASCPAACIHFDFIIRILQRIQLANNITNMYLR